MSYGASSSAKSAADKAAEEQRQRELQQKLATAQTFNASPTRYSYSGPKGAGGQLNQAAQMAASRAAGYNMPSVNVSPQDISNTARMMIAESRNIRNPNGGISTPGMQGVAEVIRNRVISGQFPNTVGGVLTQKKQFSPIADGSFARITPNDPDYQTAYNVAKSVFNGTSPPTVGNSLNYGNNTTINNKPGYSTPATQNAVNASTVNAIVADAKKPGVFAHTFGNRGPSDVSFPSYKPDMAAQAVAGTPMQAARPAVALNVPAPLSGSANNAEGMAQREFIREQIGDLQDDPAVSRQLTNAIGQGLVNTRFADAMRIAKGQKPKGNFGERTSAPWEGAGFRTAAQAASNVARGTGVGIDRTFHGMGLATDITVKRMPGETEQQWSNRNALANAELAKNIHAASGVTWGGDWRKKDFSHFQLGQGSKLAAAVEKYGSPVQRPGIRPGTQVAVAKPVAKTIAAGKKAVQVAEAIPKTIVKAPGKIARAVMGPKAIAPTFKPEARIAALAAGLNGVQQAMATPQPTIARDYLIDTSTPAPQAPAAPQMASAAAPSVLSSLGSFASLAGQKYDEAKAAAMAKAEQVAAGYKQVADAVNALPGTPGRQAAMVKGYATGGKWGAMKAGLTYKEPKAEKKVAAIAKSSPAPVKVAQAPIAKPASAPTAVARPAPIAVAPAPVPKPAPSPAQVAAATPPAAPTPAPEYTPPGLTPAGKFLQNAPLVKTAFALDKWARSRNPRMKNAPATSRPSFAIASAQPTSNGKSTAKREQELQSINPLMLAMLLGEGETYV